MGEHYLLLLGRNVRKPNILTLSVLVMNNFIVVVFTTRFCFYILTSKLSEQNIQIVNPHKSQTVPPKRPLLEIADGVAAAFLFIIIYLHIYIYLSVCLFIYIYSFFFQGSYQF